MANKRNKKKLNSKQAQAISLIISAIYCILILVYGLISKPVGEVALYYWTITFVVGTVLVYFIFNICIFKVDNKKDDEKNEEIKNSIIKCLYYEHFTQVYFLTEGCNSDKEKICQSIMQKEDCKFYAKLTKNNNIHLIAIDKHNEEVYNDEIKSYIYFGSNFKF